MNQKQRYIIDRIGEETDLEKCALCHALSCFSCVSDHCTALKRLTEGGCAFYKDYNDNHKEIRKCFYRLIRNERFDLLVKYADTLAALGLMDQEIGMARDMSEEMEKHRVMHLKELVDQNWKDSLVIIVQNEEADAADDEEPADTDAGSGQDELEQEAETRIDDSLDRVDLPFGMTDRSIDDETAEEIQTRDHILCDEIRDENFHIYEILHEANERLVMDTGQDDLPEDYGDHDDDEALETDENGNLLIQDEYMEREIEKERRIEAEEEKGSLLIQEEHNRVDDGEEAYVSLPLNYFYKTIGFPVRRKQPPDPVILACGNLGANIIYQAAEDYIGTLRMLWSGEYQGHAIHQLIVQKWQLETFIGSRLYWQFTNIAPERILDQCWQTAQEQAVMKIERINKRIAAGIEE